MILGFSGEEECGFKDIGGVVCHEGVGDIKPLNVLDSSCLVFVSFFPIKSLLGSYGIDRRGGKEGKVP